MSNFSTWLFNQKNRDDPIGDLAIDAKSDFGWPKQGNSLGQFESYLRSKRADSYVIRTLHEAWEEWSGDTISDHDFEEEDLIR